MVFYFYSQLLQDPEELYQRRGKNVLKKEYCSGSNNMKVSVQFWREACNVNTIIILKK